MILGLIPARGGSKGIPQKNIIPIAGKPLIAWTIEAAKASKSLDKFIVSTDDKGIKEIAQEWDADVQDRPAEFANDQASTLSVLEYVIQTYPETDTLVLLQPTSPIRDTDLIDRCVERFQESDADSLATGWFCKYKPYGDNYFRRQDIEGFFYDDGNVYVIKADIIRQGDRYGDKHELMTIDREQNVEIDDDFDRWLVERILLKRNQTP